MSRSDETRTITGWRTASKLYRRPPGLGWLLALIAVPLLLGLIGWSTIDRAGNGEGLTLPNVDASATLSAPEPDAPNPAFAPLSITRNGNDITLTGDVPDEAAKAALIDSMRAKFGPDVNLIDNLTVKPGVSTPDPAALGPVFEAAAAGIPDFDLKIDGDTLTLSGTAASEEVRAAVEAAARSAWPNMKITNNIQVGPVPAPAAPAPPAPGAPGGPAGPCAALQNDVTALLRTPINFETGGFVLTGPSEQLLTQVAEKLKSCEGARATVTGYTDNSGNDEINVPLSANRAKSVADFLVSQGLAADRVSSNGAGSANPIAGNDTPEGKAQNRRVEVTVN
ncbi:channel-forming protein ArfA/OmpATb [Mycobacterium sp. NPDC003449]